MSAASDRLPAAPLEQAELWACTLDLFRRSGPWPKGDYQRQVHAAFLRWLQAVDPPLAGELHRPNAIRPFTVAVLGAQDRVPSTGVTLRCTLLDRRVFQAFVQRCLPGGGSLTWRLGGAEFELARVGFAPDRAGWTGWTSFAGLLERAGVEPQITIEFATPAAFSMGDEMAGAATEDTEPVHRKRVELFPQSRWVWESWLRKWNAFAPTALQMDGKAVASTAVRGLVADYELRTVTLDYGRFPQKGFVGWVRYEFRSATALELRQLNALADFAFYAGTGYKTAQGMGQTRRRP